MNLDDFPARLWTDRGQINWIFSGKFGIMWEVLSAKYEQRTDFAELLHETQDRTIVEGNVWDDRIWGATGHPLYGRNALGVMLMKLRDAA